MAKDKHLVIVESPSKAKTISRFLGSEYIVEASFGHIRDLPESAKDIPASLKKHKWARLGVDVESDFEPLYVVPDGKQKHVKKLKDAMKSASSILLATDEDREGESISWHVLQVLKPPKGMKVERIAFHEVTKEAIEEAISQPRPLNEKRVEAQEARRIVDRLYGYEISPLLWKTVSRGLSAGRVQSVAVRLCVMRERERISFVRAGYWDLVAKLTAGGSEFEATLDSIDDKKIADGKSFDPLTGKLKDSKRLLLLEEEAKKLADSGKKSKPWVVKSLETSPASQSPSPPYTTSTLQQEGNRKLKMTAKRTMQIAQQLYEGVDLGGERVGLITYMRTDSLTLSEKAIEQARSLIKEDYGAEYLPKSPVRYKTKSKGAQEAHEAIRPTDLKRKPASIKPYVSDEQFKLYELIWKRTIACQMLPAKFERTNVSASVFVSSEELVFTASGRRILFPGFLKAYVEGSDDPEAELDDKEKILPALKVGQELEAKDVNAIGHETKPPLRYTEASLVKRLEEEGIGRPSTYATIISTIIDKGYVFKRGNELVPTFTAFAVTELLEHKFNDLVQVKFTASLEDKLDMVAEGKLKRINVLNDFYFGDSHLTEQSNHGLKKRVENFEPEYPAISIGKTETGEEVVVRIGRYGAYINKGDGGKENQASVPPGIAPDELNLDKALSLLNGKTENADSVGTDPGTGRSIVLRDGRYGLFLALEQTEEERESKQKTKMVSLPKGLGAADVDEQIAVKLMSLPRNLGNHPETGKSISTAIGRFGPYLKHGDEFRSLPNWETACDIALSEAIEILKQPKPIGRRTAGKPTFEVLAEFGAVKVLNGRYGPYVTDGKVNVSLPKGTDPNELTEKTAVELLETKKKSAKRSRK